MRAVFLDRDGVINRYPGDKAYVTSPARFRFLPRAKAAIALLNNHGYAVFVISNQAGVGKGVYSQRTLEEITVRMLREVAKAGGRIAAAYYCTHKPDENCPCRKPKAGMIRIARRDFGIKKQKSFFIGDTIRDVRAAKAGNCRSVLVLSGREKLKDRAGWEAQPDFICRDLYEAAGLIIAQG